MNKKNLLIVALVSFCLISTLFIAMPALGVTSPPFDLYAAVKGIQTTSNWILGNLTNALPQLSTLQSALTDLEAKLWSGTDSVKNKLGTVGSSVDSIVNMLTNGGSFYEFVNTWFWNIDHEISDVQDKVDSIDQKVSSASPSLQVVYAKSGEMETFYGKTWIVLRVRTNCTCQVTLTVCTHLAPSNDNEIDVYTDHSGWQYPIYKETGSDFSDQYYSNSMTFAANSTQIQITGRSLVSFKIIAMGPPNTVVTEYLSDVKANVTSEYP